MLRLLGIGHDAFERIEVLNPRFVAGAPKICITVDTEPCPRIPEPELVVRLLSGFPGLAQHECRVRGARVMRIATGTRIQLLEDDPSANQAHLLEHLIIDLLGVFEPRVVRSGVTCAWQDPSYRNDVFIECADPQVGGAAAAIAVMAMEAALAGQPLAPLYTDLARVWAVFANAHRTPVPPWQIALNSGLSSPRVEHALALLTGSHLLLEEPFGLSFGGEPHYRLR